MIQFEKKKKNCFFIKFIELFTKCEFDVYAKTNTCLVKLNKFN